MNAAVREAARARIAVFAAFGGSGFIMASWLSRIPDVKSQLDLTPGQTGVLLLSLAAGSLISLPTAGRIAHHVGAAHTLRLGAAASLVGILLAVLAIDLGAPMGVAMAGLFIFGLGVGPWDVAQNLEGSVVEQRLGREIMPHFHAAWSGGTVVAALAGAGLTALAVPISVHVGIAVLVATAAALWSAARFIPAKEDPGAEAEAAAAPGRSAWLEPRTILIGLIVFAAGLAEGVANDWLAVAFVDGHGVPPAVGVLALAVFLTSMTAGRIFGPRALERFGRVPVLRVLFAGVLVGSVLVAFGGIAGAFIGAAIWGFGSSLGFPVGMSAAADDPKRAALRIGVVATIGYLAFLAGAPLIGFLGDHFGVLRAVLAVGACSILAIAVAAAAAKPARDGVHATQEAPTTR